MLAYKMCTKQKLFPVKNGTNQMCGQQHSEQKQYLEQMQNKILNRHNNFSLHVLVNMTRTYSHKTRIKHI
jgi:hypothetical protein